MKIVNQYRNENDIENITKLTCVCLAAIHQSRSGEPVYIGTFVKERTEASEGELAV